MSSIYKKAFAFYSRSLPLLLLCALLLEGLILWLGEGISFIPLTVIAYLFHRHFLFGEAFSFARPTPDAPPQRLGWFLVLSLALVLAPIIVAFIGAATSLDPDSFDALLEGESTEGLDILNDQFLLLFCVLYLIALSMFGTVLPALVARTGRYQISAGLKATFQTMWRLVLGPGVIGATLIAVLYGLEAVAPSVMAPEGTIGQLALNTLATTLSFLPTIMAVAVLCYIYDRIAPAADAGPHPPA